MIPGIVAGRPVAWAPPPADPYWNNVVALLNFPGADGSTAFTDATGKVWTPSGSAQIDTSLGYNAGYFPGSPSRIVSATHSDWAMGTGDFTIEAWSLPSVLSGDRPIFQVGTVNGVSFGLTSSGKLFCGPTSSSYGPIGSTALSTSVIQHIEASRSGGTMRLFLNGVLDGSESDSYNYPQSIAVIGAASTNDGSSFASGYYQGHHQAVRVTKGVARHTTDASFTPPAPPFPTS